MQFVNYTINTNQLDLASIKMMWSSEVNDESSDGNVGIAPLLKEVSTGSVSAYNN
jgi:hypothetical protein